MNYHAFRRICQGQANATLESLAKIGAALGADPADLLRSRSGQIELPPPPPPPPSVPTSLFFEVRSSEEDIDLLEEMKADPVT